MKVRPSAIISNGESVLTLRYNYGNCNVFALPGGNPDPGENLTKALARELTEELGISSDIGKMIVSGEVIWDEIGRETLHIVFAANITDGIPELNPEQTTALELVWLPLSELETTLLYPNLGKSIKKFLLENIESAHVGVIEQPYMR